MIKYGMVLILLLSGCAEPSITQKRDILLKRAPSDYFEYNGNKPLSINLIRSELVSNGWENQDFLNNLSKKCYGLSYSNSGECTIDFYNEELKNKKRDRDYDTCSKSVECSKERETNNAINELNSKYYIAMARNRYTQSALDFEIREMCKAVGVGQRRGLTREDISNHINQVPGVSPENRYYLRDIADSCWILSKNGIKDGATRIKNTY
ncbi:hypothetical protein ACIPSD_04575 [Pectobacterium sp. CHL-2024]|uniref:hypothetical protein n=1 Tax=Pectobacterium sp. CHL-2024 TaxID=3377079 RepID=UPI0037F9921E